MGTFQKPSISTFDCPGGMFELEVAGGVPLEGLFDRCLGKEQADPGAVGLGLAVGVIVDLDDGVGPFREHPADSFGESTRLVTRCPAAEVAVDFDLRAGEAGISGTGLGVILLLAFAGDVDIREHVVNHAAIAGAVFDCRDVHIVRKRCRHDEASVDVGAVGGDREVGGGLEDEVGGAEGPVVWKLRVGGVSEGLPSGAPAVAQAARVAMSSEESERSCLKCGPTPGAGFQGGIERSSVTSAMSDARFRACS